MTEYCRETEVLSIHHIAVYKCLLKPNIKKYRLQARDAVVRNGGLGVCGIQQAELGEAVAAGDIKYASEKAI